MKINEIFFSIQGEGQYIGLPMVFIRVTGCNLRCNWCDTKYAYDKGSELVLDEILNKISKYKTKYVCVTGGEPLANNEINQLLEKLLESGYTIFLETNGSLPINTIPKSDSIKISLDIKCPSSGEEAKMDFSNFDHLKAGDQVKFIIADEQDYSHAVKVYSSYLQNAEFEIIFTPCDFEPSDVTFSLQTLAEKVLNDGLEVRVLPQLHKILWPSKKHGV